MIRIVSLLALLLFAGAASAASSRTGVAFVHGTGKQTNAYNDYWQPTMVNTVRQGLVNQSNYVVINCDFEQYMWDSRAAGCLASQLTGCAGANGADCFGVCTEAIDAVFALMSGLLAGARRSGADSSGSSSTSGGGT